MNDNESFSRERLLIGAEGLCRLEGSRVLVIGLGGVGGAAVECLARAGIGSLGLVDPDVVALSNVNRQLIAFPSTVGRKKTDLWRERVLSINPAATVTTAEVFILPDALSLDLRAYDVIVEAIDTVSAKIAIAAEAARTGTPLVSAMGTGNKRHPELFRVSPLEETEGDALARVMRREFKRRALPSIPVVWSPEEDHGAHEIDPESGKTRNGTLSFVPLVAGALLASWAVSRLLS